MIKICHAPQSPEYFDFLLRTKINVSHEEFPAIVTARVFPLSKKPEDVVIVLYNI